MKPVRVFKKTEDDWFPSFDGDLVEVSFLRIWDGTWRVCAWGKDDFGLERDFAASQEAEAWNVFLQVIGMENVNQSSLQSLGFVGA